MLINLLKFRVILLLCVWLPPWEQTIAVFSNFVWHLMFEDHQGPTDLPVRIGDFMISVPWRNRVVTTPCSDASPLQVAIRVSTFCIPLLWAVKWKFQINISQSWCVVEYQVHKNKVVKINYSNVAARQIAKMRNFSAWNLTVWIFSKQFSKTSQKNHVTLEMRSSQKGDSSWRLTRVSITFCLSNIWGDCYLFLLMTSSWLICEGLR